jgi:peptidylprolyl isomerase
MMLKGWEESLLYFAEGSSGKVILPSSQGYGRKGLPGKVPPDSILIYHFEIEKVN